MQVVVKAGFTVAVHSTDMLACRFTTAVKDYLDCDRQVHAAIIEITLCTKMHRITTSGYSFAMTCCT